MPWACCWCYPRWLKLRPMPRVRRLRHLRPRDWSLRMARSHVWKKPRRLRTKGSKSIGNGCFRAYSILPIWKSRRSKEWCKSGLSSKPTDPWLWTKCLLRPMRSWPKRLRGWSRILRSGLRASWPTRSPVWIIPCGFLTFCPWSSRCVRKNWSIRPSDVITDRRISNLTVV
jgi:TonB family C-terminal domain